jgi:hypothetical protein
MVVYRLGEIVVTVDDAYEWLETRFPDGRAVTASSNPRDPTSVTLADELGYAQDTWLMSRDHELAHTWLAQCEGEPWSRTLWTVAHGGNLDEDWVRLEERRVLDWQRVLDKGRPRPWETV